MERESEEEYEVTRESEVRGGGGGGLGEKMKRRVVDIGDSEPRKRATSDRRKL